MGAGANTLTSYSSSSIGKAKLNNVHVQSTAFFTPITHSVHTVALNRQTQVTEGVCPELVFNVLFSKKLYERKKSGLLTSPYLDFKLS